MEDYVSNKYSKTLDNTSNVMKILTKIRKQWGMIYPFEYTKFWTGSPLEQLDTLNQGAELMQQTDEKEHRFMKHVGIMVSAYKMCHNDDSIKQTEVNEAHFFSGVKSIIFKLTKGEAPDATKMNKRVLKMVNDSLIS